MVRTKSSSTTGDHCRNISNMLYNDNDINNCVIVIRDILYIIITAMDSLKQSQLP